MNWPGRSEGDPPFRGIGSIGDVYAGAALFHAPPDSIIIPDARLLFTADFKRAGVDLVLSDGGRELVLLDYFKGEKRAALASPDGAHLTGDLVSALTGYTQFAQADGSNGIARIIGHVTKLVGNATVVRNGVSIILNQGDNVEKGDVVQTGSDSRLGITFIDGTVFGLSQDSRMVLNEMVYDPNGSNNSSLFSLVAGTISFVAGETAKRGDMKVDTPVATMGIRGTAVLVEIDFNVPGGGGTPDAKFRVLLEPDGTSGSYILYDKNTLSPITTVNQPGTQTSITGQGVVNFLSAAPLSADAQNIITDVFSLKFTSTNPKSLQKFTDSVVPLPFNGLQLAFDAFVNQTFNLNTSEKLVTFNRPDNFFETLVTIKSISVTPVVDKASFTIAGQVSIADSNPIDLVLPFVPGTAAILSVVAPSGIPAGVDLAKLVTIDQATGAIHYDPSQFSFLGANQQVLITIGFDSMAGSDIFHETLSVIITGVNTAPTIVDHSTTAVGKIAEIAAITGSATSDSVAGSIAFADVNLSDTHRVSQAPPIITWSAGALNASQIAALTSGGTLTLTTDSTGSGTGSITWKYSANDNIFDFLADGQTLTLTYPVTIDDGQGGTVTQNVAVTITGSEDVPKIETTSGTLTELPGTGNAVIDHADGTITFSDADFTDRPAVTAQFVSFTYQNASHDDVTSSLTAQQLAAIAAVETLPTLTPSAANAHDGSVAWSYDVDDSKFDFLGAGETLRLTYKAMVDDGHGGVISQQFTVTISGTNDVPTIATTSDALTELPGADPAAIDHAGGTITFSDADLADRPVVSAEFTSFICLSASHDDETSSLTAQQRAAIAAVEASLTLTPAATNANNGSVSWSYDVTDSKFRFLAPGETLQLTYAATVDDGHGGVVSQPFTMTIVGTNHLPSIIGETDAPTLTVVAVNSGGPIVLDPGVNTGSLSFGTETFDGQPSGSSSNNGAGFGNFFSAALDAEFSAIGGAGIVNGTSNVTAAPLMGPLPGSLDTTNYLSINGGTESITFAHHMNSFGLYWGSIDSYNSIKFFDGTTLVATFTGSDLNQVVADGSLDSFESARYVEFFGLGSFDKVVLQSGQAFEIDNISAGSIHAQLAAPIAGTLTVSDVDIGDTLTGLVTGNATIEYNGSTTLPAGVDVSALISASAIKFDSATGDGGPEVLHWTYDPANANLDFLRAGDTLTITYTAQVNDGFGSVGDQPLTVTIVGTSASANMSGFQFVSGTSQNETFQNVGNGVTIFGGGGQDTFVFNAAFKSATIGDFDVNKDTIDISHTLFASVSDILSHAQSINSGHDTIITDAAHNTITLIGVTVAQIQAHPSDFSLS